VVANALIAYATFDELERLDAVQAAAGELLERHEREKLSALSDRSTVLS
jgi:hypothetical protein